MVEEKNDITPWKLTESVSCLVRTIFAKGLESSLQLRQTLFLAVEEIFNFKLKGCVLSWVCLQVWYYMIHIQVQMLHLTAFKLCYTLNLTSSPDCVRIQIGLFIASLECYHTESWSYLWWNKRNCSPAVMQKQ